MSNNLKVEQIVQGIVRTTNFEREDFPAGLLYDSVGCGGEETKDCLVMNGRTGEVQFYSLENDRQLYCVSFQNFESKIFQILQQFSYLYEPRG